MNSWRNSFMVQFGALALLGCSMGEVQGQFAPPLLTVPPAEKPPGQWPYRVSGANIDVETAPGSVLGGANADNLRVRVPQSGPYLWTESRHNEGDLAIEIGPNETEGSSYLPPDDFVNNFAVTTGPVTHAWRVNMNFGIALASTRVNGRDNQDTFADQLVGTVYGVSAFKNGGSQGWSYNMVNGNYSNGGDGAQDLQMCLAGIGGRGSDGEGSFSVGAAFFPFAEGWVGAHVGVTSATGGEVTFPGTAFSPLLTTDVVKWIADDTGQFSGHARVVLPARTPDDGLLLGCATSDDNDGKIFAAYPNNAGWDVTIRNAENITADGTELTPANKASFCFLYVPFNSPRLIGGLVNGAGEVVKGSGNFVLQRSAPGQYELTIPGKSGSDGALLFTVAGPQASAEPLADRTFLSYEVVGGKFLIQSREAVAGAGRFDLDYPLRDTQFAFVWVDFAEPLSPPYPSGPTPAVTADHQPPGAFPNHQVSGANIDVTTIADSVLGGANSDNLKVKIVQSGPDRWSESRHNEGDLAITLNPNDPVEGQPPDDFASSFQPNSGAVTYAWRINISAGIAVASVRVNGRDNGDTFGGAAVGTVYGLASFKEGGSSGWSYNMRTGFYQDGGGGAQDLQMNLAGIKGRASDGEGSFSVGAAFFPYDQGWIGGIVHGSTTAGGEVTFTDNARSPLLHTNVVKWVQNAQGQYDGHARIAFTAADYRPEAGMLFGGYANDDNNGKVFSTYPNNGGWDVAVREAEDVTPDGSLLATAERSSFSFVCIPFASRGLIGAHVSGDGTLIQKAGDFSLSRTGPGNYELTIPGKSGSDGTLILAVAGKQAGSEALPDRAFLSYEYVGNKFVIQAREVLEGTGVFNLEYPQRDTDFVFAWMDFTTPLTPPDRGTSPVTPPSLSIAKTGNDVTLSWPANAVGYVLQNATTLSNPDWTASTEPVVEEGGFKKVIVSPTGTARFYRLRQP